MYKLTQEEKETTINWCAADDTVTVDTADPVVLRKLDKLAEAYPDTYRVVRIDPNYVAKTYSFPAKYIRFVKPASEAKIAAMQKARSFTSKHLCNTGEKTSSPCTADG
jgi:hypothetical protein